MQKMVDTSETFTQNLVLCGQQEEVNYHSGPRLSEQRDTASLTWVSAEQFVIWARDWTPEHTPLLSKVRSEQSPEPGPCSFLKITKGPINWIPDAMVEILEKNPWPRRSWFSSKAIHGGSITKIVGSLSHPHH